MSAPLPVGSLRTYDSARPILTDGPHRIRVATLVEESSDGTHWHDLGGVAASDSFVTVTGAEHRLAADAVLMAHPAPNSTGDYSDTLPHVVLRDRSLPWQRTLEAGAETGAPWLALLVFDAGQCTVERSVQAPDGLRQDRVSATDAAWRAVLPRAADLELLTHVRQVNVDDRELSGGDDDGWVAVVTANRLPAAGQTHHACLVSVAGQQALLQAAADGSPNLPVTTLPLLHDWSFGVTEGGTFHDVLAGVAARSSALAVSPASPVVLPWTDRGGVSGEAAYHGPLAGTAGEPAGAVPDVSADAAFQLGRLITASDRSLSRELSEWHRQDLLETAATVADHGVDDRAQASRRSSLRSAQVPQATTTDVALARLTARRADPWGVPPVAGGRDDPGPASTGVVQAALARRGATADDTLGATADPTPRLARLATRLQTVVDAGGAAADPPPAVLAALTDLGLLRGLPLVYLVPSLALLPDESIRFFSLDPDWFDALARGLLSVGGTGNRSVAFVQRNAAAARTLVAPDTVTGLLLRSSAVSRWPQLELRAFPSPAPAPDADPAGLAPLTTLRLERLTPSLLIALFAGTPAAVWIEEPHHGLQLGFDRDPGTGALNLPSRLTGGVPVGVPTRGDTRLVDVPGLAAALAAQRGLPALGAGALAAALLRPPYRQCFS